MKYSDIKKMAFTVTTALFFSACGGGGGGGSTLDVDVIVPQCGNNADMGKAIAIDVQDKTIEKLEDGAEVRIWHYPDATKLACMIKGEARIVDTVTITATIPVSLTLVSELHNDVRETSGLAKVNGKVYTHNDGGSSALLYEINAVTGDVVRTITVNGATNVDWEDLACDDSYLYIADTGNNLGNRTDLKIYKILKSDLDANLTVDAETIAFSYADQTIFDYEPFTTPYDAEALIAYNGQLSLFTKNWADYTSRIYSVPTVPGSYAVTSVGEKALDVMVTGAAIDGTGSSVALVGYTNPYDTDIPFKSMIVKLSSFSENNFFSGNIAEYEIANSQSVGQVEAILFNTSSELYLTAEGVTILSVEYPAIFYEAQIR